MRDRRDVYEMEIELCRRRSKMLDILGGEGVSLPQYNTIDLAPIFRELDTNAEVLMERMTEHYNKLMEGKKEWISTKERYPSDDQTVFVINNKVQMLPIKAYYCEAWDEFMSLENGDGTNHPLSITHWMELPGKP